MVSLTDLVASVLLYGKISSGPPNWSKPSSSKYKVFPGSIAMDFIFEFAIIGGVFAKVRLINDKIDLFTHQSD